MGVPWQIRAVLLAVGIGAVPSAVASHASGRASVAQSSSAVATVTVSASPHGEVIRSGFVGLSMEYPTVTDYVGSDPLHLDPVIENLVRNLAPGQRPILRIGGDTTDWTWAPVAGMKQPPWVRFTLTTGFLQVASALTRSLHALIIPSINLEAASPTIASAEARAWLGSLDRRSILAFELGNEPELYGSFSWYRTPAGVHVRGRPRSYNFAAYMRDYAKVAEALPGLPLAGPSTGAGPAWTQPLPVLLQAQPRVAVVTMHRYGLDHCSKSDPLPTIPRLMSDAAQLGVAQSVATPATEAKARHLPLRIEELNAVACGGEPGVSNTFASALWALQTLFESIRVGVAGVNIHTRTAGVNSLFSAQIVNGRWTAVVKPEYYGLMMFAHAVPPGAQLLPTTGTTGDARVHLWAIRLPHGGTRVVLINEDPRRADVITVRIPGRNGRTALERLRAPSLNATAGVTLGGQGFGATTSSGVLSGLQTVAVRATNGSAVVRVPAASAAMLTVAGR